MEIPKEETLTRGVVVQYWFERCVDNQHFLWQACLDQPNNRANAEWVKNRNHQEYHEEPSNRAAATISRVFLLLVHSEPYQQSADGSTGFESEAA